MRLVPSASRTRRLLIAGAASGAAAVALTAPSAHADFSLGSCGATNPAQFKGQGSSFQGAAQTFWSTQFTGSSGCNGSTPAPAYTGNGSGNGNASMGTGGGNNTILCAATCIPSGQTAVPAGVRDSGTRFAGTDEAPTAAQIVSADNGPTTSAADDGKLRVIPAALGAATFVVRLPTGCVVTGATNGLTGGSDGTGDTAADQTQRVKVPNSLIEKAFAGEITTWKDLVPGVDAACGAKNIVRVVRQDNSGTTLSFKTFLDKINPSRGWLSSTSGFGGGQAKWPKGGGDNSAVSPAPNAGNSDSCATAALTLCSANGSGGGNLGTTAAATDGSIGYIALSDARSKGFTVTPSTAPAAPDLTYWTPLQDLTSGAAYHEPTNDSTAHKPNVGTLGSACANIPVSSNAPGGSDPTLNGDFSQVTAVGTTTYNGYPDCVLTYELAWDDDSAVWGTSAAEEQNARAVKDYLTKAVVSAGGQLFTNTDYSTLPAGLLKIAQDGVNAIGWNKSGGGVDPGTGNGGGGGGGAAPAPQPQGPSQVLPAPIKTPSNAFSITSSKSASTGLTFKVQLPGAGALSAKATAKSGKKTITVGSASATVNAAGTATVTIRLSSAAKSALKKAKSHKLSVSTAITFTPAGGKAASQTKSLSVKAATKKKSSKKKSSKKK